MEIKLCNVCFLRRRESDDLFFILDDKKVMMCQRCWEKGSQLFKTHNASELFVPGLNLDILKAKTTG